VFQISRKQNHRHAVIALGRAVPPGSEAGALSAKGSPPGKPGRGPANSTDRFGKGKKPPPRGHNTQGPRALAPQAARREEEKKRGGYGGKRPRRGGATAQKRQDGSGARAAPGAPTPATQRCERMSHRGPPSALFSDGSVSDSAVDNRDLVTWDGPRRWTSPSARCRLIALQCRPTKKKTPPPYLPPHPHTGGGPRIFRHPAASQDAPVLVSKGRKGSRSCDFSPAVRGVLTDTANPPAFGL